MITAGILCLALNIYHEARGEIVDGQMAVAQVTLNRTLDPRWPDNICDVVYDDSQFSWTRNIRPVDDWDAFQLALNIALEAEPDPDMGTHFHSISVSPDWATPEELIGQIGRHRFYQ
jgi:N-acetylmuramoyl-L-alanine amidase